MLPCRSYFEWCHGVKLAALNYCRPFDAVYIPAVLSTHIIILQILHPGPDIANNAAQKHKRQHLVPMIQHKAICKSLKKMFFSIWLLCYLCGVNVLQFCFSPVVTKLESGHQTWSRDKCEGVNRWLVYYCTPIIMPESQCNVKKSIKIDAAEPDISFHVMHSLPLSKTGCLQANLRSSNW